MATEDWVRIWLRTKLVISVATFTSEILDSEFCKFSAWIVCTEAVFSRQLFFALIRRLFPNFLYFHIFIARYPRGQTPNMPTIPPQLLIQKLIHIYPIHPV